MRVYLGDDGEVDVEVEIQSFERDVGAETAVFPFVAEGIRDQGTGAGFHHEHDRIQNTWYSCRGKNCGPYHAVWRGEVVGENSGNGQCCQHG